MSATLTPRPVEVAAPAPLLPGYRFELAKLVSQWRVRILLLACWMAPAAFVAVVSRQSSLPADTVFGRWMGTTGWAGSLVVLGFACSWVLPLVTSLVAGDVFATEDRLGTWRHLLVAVRSPRRIFVAKALASLTVVLVVLVGLAASGMVGGLVAVGDHPLPGLDGHLLAPGDAARTVLLAWLCVVAPTLAFAAVGLLGSVVLGRSPMGLLLPAVVALAMDLVLVLPVPVAVRLALPSGTFLAWRGLFTDPGETGPLVVGVAVSLGWAAVCTGLAYLLFLRRDFTDLAYDGAGRRAVLTVAVPLAALLALTTAVTAATTSATGVTKGKLEHSLATSFAHLYRLQTRELGRPAVTEEQLASTASCDKGGSRVAAHGPDDHGPGNDWRCVVSWHLPGATAVGSATYQLDATADGRYVADGDGPKEVNGFFQVRSARGDAPNPLWQFDGIVDLLSRS
ncbi:ABC-2 type transport system permease protein [Motilibacter rhizosphaerae]|uniref:ABC-2 type transport system permease protein n=1 Tax=Motilibacter rhizosphaerae TaxID=598652 RepID=A0A4Q7NFY2_9ACTN|nr:ABC transporter permease [Motilibacter rhizosphaerae]RZS82674.1 ABC-2 type transport system permease protein [Motilibacter rhizosphaerae]